MSVREQDVRAVAQLAKLSMTDAELNAATGDLNGILAHMDVLSAVDTSALDAPQDDDADSALRPDEGPSVTLSRPRDAFAPAMRDGFFLVPRLESHDEAGGAA